MFKWDTEDKIEDLFLTSAFKVESEYLSNKRKELIHTDSITNKKMLVNNPNRELTLRKPTVLTGGLYA